MKCLIRERAAAAAARTLFTAILPGCICARFSPDHNRTWETNWTADFTRADTSKTCESGRPRRS